MTQPSDANDSRRFPMKHFTTMTMSESGKFSQTRENSTRLEAFEAYQRCFRVFSLPRFPYQFCMGEFFSFHIFYFIFFVINLSHTRGEINPVMLRRFDVARGDSSRRLNFAFSLLLVISLP
jgi:hypothetical protein